MDLVMLLVGLGWCCCVVCMCYVQGCELSIDGDCFGCLVVIVCCLILCTGCSLWVYV